MELTVRGYLHTVSMDRVERVENPHVEDIFFTRSNQMLHLHVSLRIYFEYGLPILLVQYGNTFTR